MGHIFSTVFGMYILVLWVVFVIALIDLPFELLSIASVVILLPILVAPLQYRSAKERYGTLQEAGAALKEIEGALDEKLVVSGLTSYIFLIFDVIRPPGTYDIETSENEIEDLRRHLEGLTRRVVTEIAFQGVMYILLIVNFIIPEFEQGGVLAIPLLFLCVIIAILAIRWVIFIYWRFLLRRWLKFYQGFITWGEELERVFSTQGGLDS
jgi:hypothetical protein